MASATSARLQSQDNVLSLVFISRKFDVRVWANAHTSRSEGNSSVIDATGVSVIMLLKVVG
jgi:hypothetical protein